MLLFERLSHEPRKTILDKVVPREALWLTGATPVPSELASFKCFGFVGPAKRLAEVTAMLELECTPDIRAFTLRLDQSVEHGFVTHSEDALDLEDADEERVPPSLVPLRRKRGF